MADSAPGRGQYSAGRLFATDVRIASMVLNEGRHRALERLFGVPREQANLFTFVAALIALEAARERSRKVFHPTSSPTRADTVIGLGIVDEWFHGVAGPSSREVPYFGALLAGGLVAAGVGPTLRRAVRDVEIGGHDVRAGLRDARAGFNKRYGYILEVARRRAAKRMDAAGRGTITE